MKNATAVIMCLALAACSKAPEAGDGSPEFGGNATAGVAFTYSYGFTLPKGAIADLQEKHAAACERLGTARCRITGLRYTVGSTGEINGSLAVKLAAPVARAFGRQAVATADDAGATLSGVEIGGTEMEGDAAAQDQVAGDATSDETRIARELARRDLPRGDRAELLRQQGLLVEQRRTAARGAAAARASVATTPMTFDYASGRGTGFANRLRDAADTALASTTATLAVAVWLIAGFGPPLLALLLLYLAWMRWGRRLWARLIGVRRADPI